MNNLVEKDNFLKSGIMGFKAELGSYQSAVDRALEAMESERVVDRLWARDHTLWKPEPREITNRLGWLTIHEKMKGELPVIVDFVNELRKEGFSAGVVLGMGGSSLAPEVFRFTFGVKNGFLDLSIMDSTDPDAVSSIVNKINFSKTIFIVSTKSGGTVETLSFLKYFYTKAIHKVGREKAGDHFIAVTDKGSGLDEIARELKFRRVFLSDPEIGGRYSALSHFGLVPACLLGIDCHKLIDRAVNMALISRDRVNLIQGKNPSVWLGAVLGVIGASGRDKLTLLISPSISSFGSWIEQLIAESTGKGGKGLFPVIGETLQHLDAYGKDRLFIQISLVGEEAFNGKIKILSKAGHPVVRFFMKSVYDLGAEIFRWEVATSIAGHILKINPFDQPNVESAKAVAGKMLASYRDKGFLPSPVSVLEESGIDVYWDEPAGNLEDALNSVLSYASKGSETGTGRSYVAIHAYLNPSAETEKAIKMFREKITDKTGMATSAGYGPRFLHSTGQLHKGDAGLGIFIQLTGKITKDVGIPDSAGADSSSVSFGVLKMAQALGDGEALKKSGRRVIRFHFNDDAAEGIKYLTNAIR